MAEKFFRISRCSACVAAFFAGLTAFLGTSAYFFQYRLTVGNLGLAYAWAEIAFALINALLFGAYLAMSSYRFRSYGSVRKKESGFAAA